MKVRAIMIPARDLLLLKPADTAAYAIETIEKNGFLSLPVVDGKVFKGFLSKQFIYDVFFKEGAGDFQAFLQRSVESFLFEEVDMIKAENFIEDAAEIFFRNKMRFIPVVDGNGDFEGIVTQNALFGILTKIYGLKNTKISILTDNFKGTLVRIAEIISKTGGNITNIAQLDTEVMGIQEISIRLETDDVDRVVAKLKENGFEVRELIR